MTASRGRAKVVRPILVSLGLMVLWSLGDIALLELRPLAATAGLLVLLGAFTYVHWHRPAERHRKGRAALRLRPLGSAFGIVLAGVLLYQVFDHAFVLVYMRVIPVPIEESFLDIYRYGREPFGWIPVFVSGVLIAPALEETVFRGWIQRPLERAWGVRPAIAAAAALFAIVHLDLALIPYYFVAGVALGVAVYVARSLWAGIWLHGASNATALGWELGGVDQATYQRWAENDVVLLLAVGVVALTVPLLLRMARQIQHRRRESMAFART